jgi:hypothetical protein
MHHAYTQQRNLSVLLRVTLTTVKKKESRLLFQIRIAKFVQLFCLLSFSTMSFIVTVIERDEPFTIDFGSTVEEAFDLIRQSYPDIKGRFRVITNEEIPRDLKRTDVFPADDNNKRVVFIPARPVSPQRGK